MLKLTGIIQSIHSVNQLNDQGIFVETGCALGGSSILISKLKLPDSDLYVYDVFGMIPAPSDDDTEEVHLRYKTISDGKSKGLGDDLYYGYEPELLNKVKNNFSSFGINTRTSHVHFVKGLIQETMNINEPVVFAHIDVDWYQSVQYSIENIWPNLVKGGIIILDDYLDWGGCRKAVDEYFESCEDLFQLDKSFGSLIITKAS